MNFRSLLEMFIHIYFLALISNKLQTLKGLSVSWGGGAGRSVGVTVNSPDTVVIPSEQQDEQQKTGTTGGAVLP